MLDRISIIIYTLNNERVVKIILKRNERKEREREGEETLYLRCVLVFLLKYLHAYNLHVILHRAFYVIKLNRLNSLLF